LDIVLPNNLQVNFPAVIWPIFTSNQLDQYVDDASSLKFVGTNFTDTPTEGGAQKVSPEKSSRPLIWNAIAQRRNPISLMMLLPFGHGNDLNI